MTDKSTYIVRLTYEIEVEATNTELAIGTARSRIERYQSLEDRGPKAEIVESTTQRLVVEGEDIGQRV